MTCDERHEYVKRVLTLESKHAAARATHHAYLRVHGVVARAGVVLFFAALALSHFDSAVAAVANGALITLAVAVGVLFFVLGRTRAALDESHLEWWRSMDEIDRCRL
jgi:ABC-type transport system involved in cytochrome bd biosynthesis fused ATPase/permease subunit